MYLRVCPGCILGASLVYLWAYLGVLGCIQGAAGGESRRVVNSNAERFHDSARDRRAWMCLIHPRYTIYIHLRVHPRYITDIPWLSGVNRVFKGHQPSSRVYQWCIQRCIWGVSIWGVCSVSGVYPKDIQCTLCIQCICKH